MRLKPFCEERRRQSVRGWPQISIQTGIDDRIITEGDAFIRRPPADEIKFMDIRLQDQHLEFKGEPRLADPRHSGLESGM